VSSSRATGGVEGFSLSPDGRCLVVSGLFGKSLWDVADGRKVATLTGNSTDPYNPLMSWSPDGAPPCSQRCQRVCDDLGRAWRSGGSST